MSLTGMMGNKGNSASGQPQFVPVAVNVRGEAVVDIGDAVGILRTRFVSVTGDTAPTLTGSGCLSYTAPGVKSIVIDSVRIVSGHAALLALIVAGATNLIIRYAIDAGTDAGALALLPDTFPASSATVDAGQIRTFNLIATMIPSTVDTSRAVQLSIDPASTGRFIDVDAAITSLWFAHELGGVVLQFGVSAVEEV